MTQIEKEDMQAAYLRALLNGEIPVEEESGAEEASGGVEVVFEDEPKKKKKTRKKKVEEPVGSEKQTFTTKQAFLGEWEHGDLGKTRPINVVFGNHDIPYKEQLWPVPERIIVFNVERIDIPKVALNAAEAIHKDLTDEQKSEVKNGTIRYYKIVTYEAIPADSNYLGYVEVRPNATTKIYLRDNILKLRKVDKKAVTKAVKTAISELVAFK